MQAIEEMVGTPYFSVDDIDIMHEIEHNLYRFEPENMKPIEQPDKGRTMVVLTYQSKNSIFVIKRTKYDLWVPLFTPAGSLNQCYSIIHQSASSCLKKQRPFCRAA